MHDGEVYVQEKCIDVVHMHLVIYKAAVYQ